MRLLQNNILSFIIQCYCREEADKYEKVEALEAQNISVMAVEFSTMMEIIGFCENLTRENETVSSRIDNNVVDEEIGYWSLLRGIIPGIISYIKLLQHNVGSVLSGTLWCGVNDIAESYSSLGYNQQLDRSVSVQEKE